jgi:hypothetical protein
MRRRRAAVQPFEKLDGRRCRWLFLPTMLPTRFFAPLALAVLVLATRTTTADDLPPKEAPPYSAVYSLSSRSRVERTDDWTFKSEDTVTIATLSPQVRWDFKSDGHVVITDRAAQTTMSFGGKLPPNTATRVHSKLTTINWEFGMATVAAANDNKPEILGTTTIAGHECTRVRFVSEVYGKPEFCVTKNGIPLRFSNASSTAEAVYEAQSIDEKAPSADRFTLPAGYKVEERAAEPKRAINF